MARSRPRWQPAGLQVCGRRRSTALRGRVLSAAPSADCPWAMRSGGSGDGRVRSARCVRSLRCGWPVAVRRGGAGAGGRLSWPARLRPGASCAATLADRCRADGVDRRGRIGSRRAGASLPALAATRDGRTRTGGRRALARCSGTFSPQRRTAGSATSTNPRRSAWPALGPYAQVGERGQGTVEWVGPAGLVSRCWRGWLPWVRVPGAALARAVASRMLCAASLADGCGDEPVLIAAYGTRSRRAGAAAHADARLRAGVAGGAGRLPPLPQHRLRRRLGATGSCTAPTRGCR